MKLRQQLDRLYGRGNSPVATEIGSLRLELEKIREQQTRHLADEIDGYWADEDSGRTLVIDRSMPLQQQHAGVELEHYLSIDRKSFGLLFGDTDLFHFDPARTVFLDTETTGLSGGAGTYVFLVGLGYFDDSRFVIRQFLMPGLGAEPAHLSALSRLVAAKGFEQLVTFNGRSFDLPLLNDRYVLNRLASPFAGLKHLDLLHPSRLLWRRKFGNCSLQGLEQSVLRFYREGDIASHLIPRIFLTFARSGQTHGLRPVVRHNRTDILSMLSLCCVACRILCQAAKQAEIDSISLARFYRIRGHRSLAIEWLRRAVSELPENSPDRLHAQFRLAELLRKSRCESDALPLYLDLIQSWPDPPSSIFEGAAKILEHSKRDFAAALEIVEQAQRLYPTSTFARRHHRLVCRRAGKRWY